VTEFASGPLKRFAFRVQYDGTSYHGWQSQPQTPETIQQKVEDALALFFGQQLSIQGASRTDAGVHARDQLAAVSFQHPIDTQGFVKAMNNRLPSSIAIRDAREVALDYNPRFGNHGKTYCYRLYTAANRHPLDDRYAWRLPWTLNMSAMKTAASYLVGTHDFTSFAASDGEYLTWERTISGLRCTPQDGNRIGIRVTGNAFMKYMVRILVGTLVEVGRGRIEPAEMHTILAGRDRRFAGPTAPPRGLELERIYAHFEAPPQSMPQ
jgi:tRNA pseudouridine38-40 synthase